MFCFTDTNTKTDLSFRKACKFICSTDQSEKDSEWTKKNCCQRSQEAGLVTNFIDVIKEQDT